MSDYDFSTLSPIDFEALISDIFAEYTSEHIERFGEGKDGGIDLRYVKNNETTIIQCKRYVKSTFSNLLAALKDVDLAKLPCDKYRVVTALPLSPQQKEQIYDLFSSKMDDESFIWGKEEINDCLKKYPDVEERNFKLWMHSVGILKQIFSTKMENYTKGKREELALKAKLFVNNGGVEKSLEILKTHNVVIISGEAGIGKTTLADILALQHAKLSYTVHYVAGEFSDVEEALQKDEENKVIVFDDFFGTVRLEDSRLESAERSMSPILDRIQKRNNVRLIMTTREYILKQAYEKSDKVSGVDYMKMVLELSLYTKSIKALILYNHFYYSDIPMKYIDELLKDKFYNKIIEHEGYNPRIISWLVTPKFYEGLEGKGYASQILNILDNPEELYQFFAQNISHEAKCLVWLLSFLPDKYKEKKKLEVYFNEFYKEVSNNLGNPMVSRAYENALKEVEGTFIKIEKKYSNIVINFINPSMEDYSLNNWKGDSNLIEYFMNIIDDVALFVKVGEIFADNIDIQNKYFPEISKRFVNECGSVSIEDTLDLFCFFISSDRKIYKISNTELEKLFNNKIMRNKLDFTAPSLVRRIWMVFDFIIKEFPKKSNELKNIIIENLDDMCLEFYEIMGGKLNLLNFSAIEMEKISQNASEAVESEVGLDATHLGLYECEIMQAILPELQKSYDIDVEVALETIEERIEEIELDFPDFEMDDRVKRTNDNIDIDSIFATLKDGK